MNGSFNRRSGGGKARRNKNQDIYACLALNRLARDMDIDVNAHGWEDGVDRLLLGQRGVTKLEISHEIRTNHVQTEKLLQMLSEKGLATVSACDRGYSVKITRDGLMFVHKFNAFYASEYGDLIREHYRYVGPPAWFRGAR